MVKEVDKGRLSMDVVGDSGSLELISLVIRIVE